MIFLQNERSHTTFRMMISSMFRVLVSILATIIITTTTLADATSSEADHRYTIGEEIRLWVNRVRFNLFLLVV